jgi:hypothetical protein
MSVPSVDIFFELLPSTEGPSPDALLSALVSQLSDPMSKLRLHSQFGSLAQVSELSVVDQPPPPAPAPVQSEKVR